MSLAYIIETTLEDSRRGFGRTLGIVNALRGNPRLSEYETKLLDELEALAEREFKNLCKLSRNNLVCVAYDEVEKWKT